MVLKPEPLVAAIEALRGAGRAGDPPDPRGRRFTQDAARELAAGPTWCSCAGRYEGVDERVSEHSWTRSCPSATTC